MHLKNETDSEIYRKLVNENYLLKIIRTSDLLLRLGAMFEVIQGAFMMLGDTILLD